MNDAGDGFAVGFFLGAIGASITMLSILTNLHDKSAVERGCGQYSPKTGSFEWVCGGEER